MEISGHVDRKDQDEVNLCPVCRGPVERESIERWNERSGWISTGADRLTCRPCEGTGTLYSSGEYRWTFPDSKYKSPESLTQSTSRGTISL